mmetsp:Transcript_22620/g.51673  ORF Transcript_22620/g.51673 Transcript_22620/m.51673 type:complete len:239 (-) Transcript_22620:21-737(-)
MPAVAHVRAAAVVEARHRRVDSQCSRVLLRFCREAVCLYNPSGGLLRAILSVDICHSPKVRELLLAATVQGSPDIHVPGLWGAKAGGHRLRGQASGNDEQGAFLPDELASPNGLHGYSTQALLWQGEEFKLAPKAIGLGMRNFGLAVRSLWRNAVAARAVAEGVPLSPPPCASAHAEDACSENYPMRGGTRSESPSAAATSCTNWLHAGPGWRGGRQRPAGCRDGQHLYWHRPAAGHR